MKIAIESNLLSLIIETDYQDVVNFVLHKKSSKIEMCWTIVEIQNKMHRANNKVEIQQIPGDCNAIAHTLAKIALASGDNCIWKGYFSSHMMSVFSKPS